VRYLNEERNFVEKCTLCQEATEQGDLPACVAQCGGRARFFGDIENGIENLEGPGDYASVGDDKDYESMRQARVTLGDYVEPFTEDDIHYLTDYGTGPSFPYILRNRAWQE
jgi:Fe-S-cluster-containing dehydrogenase component